MKIGTQVTYADINLFLSGYRGRIVELGRKPNGADCVVAWTSPRTVKSDECSFNLRDMNADPDATLPLEGGR